MQKKRVLWLDCHGRENWIQRHGYEVRVLPAVDFVGFDLSSSGYSILYHPSFVFLNKLEANLNEYAEGMDWVVVGNNCGGGIRIAEALCRAGLASRIVVVWNHYPSSSETSVYKALNIEKFTSRIRGDNNLLQLLESLK